jgi:hypothetical protein
MERHSSPGSLRLSPFELQTLIALQRAMIENLPPGWERNRSKMVGLVSIVRRMPDSPGALQVAMVLNRLARRGIVQEEKGPYYRPNKLARAFAQAALSACLLSS